MSAASFLIFKHTFLIWPSTSLALSCKLSFIVIPRLNSAFTKLLFILILLLLLLLLFMFPFVLILLIHYFSVLFILPLTGDRYLAIHVFPPLPSIFNLLSSNYHLSIAVGKCCPFWHFLPLQLCPPPPPPPPPPPLPLPLLRAPALAPQALYQERLFMSAHRAWEVECRVQNKLSESCL